MEDPEASPPPHTHPSAHKRTVLTGRDVAALPVDWPWSPGAVVLEHGFVGADVHTVHTPGLEAIVSTGSCTHCPQADPPMHATDVSPAVLSAQRPVSKREGTSHLLHCARSVCHSWHCASPGYCKPCMPQILLILSPVFTVCKQK